MSNKSLRRSNPSKPRKHKQVHIVMDLKSIFKINDSIISMDPEIGAIGMLLVFSNKKKAKKYAPKANIITVPMVYE